MTHTLNEKIVNFMSNHILELKNYNLSKEDFSEKIEEFLDDFAEALGDFIGYNSHEVFASMGRFSMIMNKNAMDVLHEKLPNELENS